MAAAIDKLEHLHRLDEEDRSFVERGTRPSEVFSPGMDICHGGARPPARVIISGWAARVRILPDGRRQIFCFLLPGDMIGVPPHIPSTVTALTRVQTGDISALRQARFDGGRNPAVAKALASAADMDEALLVNQIVRLGPQTPAQRLTHLLLELADRLGVARADDQCRFAMPLTQECLADALGLSVVHINRTLQQLRQDRLITIRGGEVSLLQLSRLCGMADFTFGQIWETGAHGPGRPSRTRDQAPIKTPLASVTSGEVSFTHLEHRLAQKRSVESVGNVDF